MMRYRTFGAAGWRVSELVLGTVEIGMAYGIGVAQRPPDHAAIDLLLAAFDAGINLVDTAPAYGESERLVGAALAHWNGPVYVATKVLVPDHGWPAERRHAMVRESVEESRRRLGRDRLDLVQVHNATGEDLADGPVMEALSTLQASGKVDRLGASVYDLAAAEAAIAAGVACVQLPFSLLDRRFAAVIGKMELGGVVPMLRSIFLKGALTPRWRQLPARLADLRVAAERAEVWAGARGMGLAQAALCFARDSGHGVVLVGLGDRQELEASLSAAARPPLPPAAWTDASGLAVDDPAIVDPRRWGF